MNQSFPKKLQPDLPSARKIRRSCSNELYRTIKRLKVYIPQESIEQAEKLYTSKVLINLLYITEHKSNRKVLADWFDANVSAEIAELWNVERERLCSAFRDAFGG